MINFFKIIDPFRIIYIGLILLAIRLPVLLAGIPLLKPELIWLTIGQKMTDDAHLYAQIWQPIAPLSAACYWLIGIISSHNALGYHILSILLVLLQAFLFNKILIDFRAYNDKSYIPALLYIIFMSISIDFITLSPALLALTPLLFVSRNLLAHTIVPLDKDFFQTGIFLGIAALLYVPTVFFMLLVVIGFLSFKLPAIRQLFLILYGFVFTFTIAVSYYFLMDRLSDFYEQYFLSFFTLGKVYYHSVDQLLFFLIIPSIFLFFALLKIFLTKRSSTSYQVNCQHIMMAWIVSGIFCVITSLHIGLYQLAIFVPVFSFFSTHLLLLIRKTWILNTSFIFLLLGIIGLKYDTFFEWTALAKTATHRHLFTEPGKKTPEQNQRVLVLGNDIDYYQGNRLAGPYLNWKIAYEKHFKHLDRYDIAVEIYNNISVDFPKFIVDQANIAKTLMHRIPELKKHYEPSIQNPNIYCHTPCK